MGSTSSRAKRDATLAMKDEFDAIAQMISSAKSQSKVATSEANTWAEGAIDDLFSNYDREQYDVASTATAANMGTSGFRSAGLNDLARKKSEGVNDVEAQKMQRLMQVATTLDEVLNTARTTSKNLAAKKTLLIGQLRDQYAQEEQTLKLQKEQNDIAWYNARTSRMALGNDKPKTTKDTGWLSKPLSERVAGAAAEIQGLRMTAIKDHQDFAPTQLWGFLEATYGTQAMKDDRIWETLYPSKDKASQAYRERMKATWLKQQSAKAQSTGQAQDAVNAARPLASHRSTGLTPQLLEQALSTVPTTSMTNGLFGGMDLSLQKGGFNPSGSRGAVLGKAYLSTNPLYWLYRYANEGLDWLGGK